MARKDTRHLRQRHGGLWQYYRRTPTGLSGKFGFGEYVSKSLGTDSLRRAQLLRDELDVQFNKQFEALASGDEVAVLDVTGLLPETGTFDDLPENKSVRDSYLEMAGAQLKALVEADDFDGSAAYLKTLPSAVAMHFMTGYIKAIALRSQLKMPDNEIVSVLNRTIGATKRDDQNLMAMKVSQALQYFLDRVAVDITSKQPPSQRHKFEKQKKRSVNRFIDVVGDLPLKSIQRKHAIKFHDFWHARIFPAPDSNEKKYSSAAGIAELGDMKQIWQKIADKAAFEGKNPFEKLSFRESKRRRLPYDRQWIADKWLSKDALKDMNEEARLIVLILIETGCRPVELLRMPAERIRLDHEIPHILIDTVEGEDGEDVSSLKTEASRREIPLVGVALPAARALVAMGGVVRYQDKSGTFSAATNKFFRGHGLQQPGRTIYSLRHAFIEALKALPDVPEDLRKEIAGHQQEGSHGRNYGRFPLERKRDTISRITLPFSDF